jgi:hypothetical protein
MEEEKRAGKTDTDPLSFSSVLLPPVDPMASTCSDVTRKTANASRARLDVIRIEISGTYTDNRCGWRRVGVEGGGKGVAR